MWTPSDPNIKVLLWTHILTLFLTACTKFHQPFSIQFIICPLKIWISLLLLDLQITFKILQMILAKPRSKMCYGLTCLKYVATYKRRFIVNTPYITVQCKNLIVSQSKKSWIIDSPLKPRPTCISSFVSLQLLVLKAVASAPNHAWATIKVIIPVFNTN